MMAVEVAKTLGSASLLAKEDILGMVFSGCLDEDLVRVQAEITRTSKARTSAKSVKSIVLPANWGLYPGGGK